MKELQQTFKERVPAGTHGPMQLPKDHNDNAALPQVPWTDTTALSWKALRKPGSFGYRN